MAQKPLRVLGVDTSLRSTGVGMVEARGNVLNAPFFGTIKNPAKRVHSKCLEHLYAEISRIIEQEKPDVAAVEGIFHFKNSKTAVTLGQARGVVLAACAAAGLKVYEYAPRRVKQAIVGTGTASKDQVAQMVMRMVALSEQPQEDASDALGIAICHLHSRTTHAALAPKEI